MGESAVGGEASGSDSMDRQFLLDLKRYGPEGLEDGISLAEARSYCRHLALTHYENFPVASLLLPRHLLRHFHHVYAYCRWADDLADEAGGGPRALALLRWWREELNRCYAGCPRHPVMIALRETIDQFDIPRKPFLDLLFAFEQDQIVKEYRTFDQLLGYCRYSANPVGRLVLYLFGCHDEERGRLADSICTGLQLANFWQDVRRDADLGRVYIPLEDRERFGYSNEALAARQFTIAFRDTMRLQVERTREFFLRGLPLVDRVPSDVQIDVRLFVDGGLAILDRIERLGYNVWRQRPRLGKWTLARFLLRAVMARWRPTDFL